MDQQNTFQPQMQWGNTPLNPQSATTPSFQQPQQMQPQGSVPTMQQNPVVQTPTAPVQAPTPQAQPTIMQQENQAAERAQAENRLEQQMQVQANTQVQSVPVQPAQVVQTVQVQQPVQTVPTAQQLQAQQLQQQIQQLLAQKEQYTQQYNTIVAFLKQNAAALTQENIVTYKNQLSQLNTAYLQTEEQLKRLGYGVQNKVNKPTEVKQGAKFNFSFKKLGIGCGALLLIIGLAFGAGIYFLIQNPNAFTSIGLSTAQAKSIFSIFTGLFFWIFILIGLIWFISNIYKLITVKNQSKGKFVWWLFGALLIMGIFGAGIAFTFQQIGKIEVKEVLSSNQIVDPFIVGQSDQKIQYNSSIPLIAPMQMAYRLNVDVLQAQAKQNLWEVNILGVSLNCGTSKEQILDYDQNGFKGYCLYPQKWTYNATLTLNYEKPLTKERDSVNIPLATFNFKSEISIMLMNSKESLNAKTEKEFLVGKAPVEITIDTNTIYKDFELKDYKSEWDLDGDSTIDRTDRVNFDFHYNTPKVYYPSFHFPDLPGWEKIWYSFPIRVEQSDVQLCEITLYPLEKTKYKVQTEFLDGGSISNISNYSYSVINSETKKTIDTKKEKTLDFSYEFPDVWNYYVRLDFVTVDGKKGHCSSDYLQLATEKLTFDYTLTHQPIGEKGYKNLNVNNDKITLEKIPQDLQFVFKNLSTSNLALKKKVFIDGEALIDNDGVYHFQIEDEGIHTLHIEVEDTEKNLKTEKTITIEVTTPEIACSLKANPDSWYENLNVKFDASEVKIKDKDDSAIYFSFDFGDGEKKENITNGLINHTYTYDYDKENGEYHPKVKIRTRKGLECESSLDVPILVKKALVSVDLIPESHPTQIAKVGDTINITADFNGLPEKMTWDFGDGTEQTCKGRNCTEIEKVYEEAGNYIITLTLDFEDAQSINKNISFKIN